MVLLDQLFLWQSFCQNHFGDPYRLKIHIRGCKWLIFYSNTSSDIFKRLGCPKWFQKNFCHKKASQVEPVCSRWKMEFFFIIFLSINPKEFLLHFVLGLLLVFLGSGIFINAVLELATKDECHGGNPWIDFNEWFTSNCQRSLKHIHPFLLNHDMS